MRDWTGGEWMTGAAYDALRASEFERFCAAAGTDLTARVPTCPDWDVAGLCDHLARVYQGRGVVVSTGEFPDPGVLELRPEGDDPVLWVRRWSTRLDEVLDGLADDAATITFMPDATAVHFWRRRMALETLVHRTDAELAVGEVAAMDDALSADGIDELLWFLTHPEQEHDDGIEGDSVVVLTDGARTWSVGLADGAFGAPDPGAVPDVTVHGSAPALLLALSGRDLEGIGAGRFGVSAPVVDGDEAAYRRLLERLGGF